VSVRAARRGAAGGARRRLGAPGVPGGGPVDPTMPVVRILDPVSASELAETFTVTGSYFVPVDGVLVTEITSPRGGSQVGAVFTVAGRALYGSEITPQPTVYPSPDFFPAVNAYPLEV